MTKPTEEEKKESDEALKKQCEQKIARLQRALQEIWIFTSPKYREENFKIITDLCDEALKSGRF